MIDRNHKLSIRRQAELLGFSRGSAYYQAQPPAPEDLALMRRIDELHLEYPFMGSRMLRDMLNRERFSVGRKHVATLMKKMGIDALYQKPSTSKRHPEHKIYPYLLRGMTIDRADHVWATDITYIPMRKGFVYLCAVVDWASRKVLAYRISITLDTTFCLDALEEAITRYGVPEIFNTDQGCQFTSYEFTEALSRRGIKISMDGKGCWRDNIFVERLWKSVKYEEVYLHAYDTVSEAKAGIDRYFKFHNCQRPHSKLDKLTPDEYYTKTKPQSVGVA
jgi:putative transposase